MDLSLLKRQDFGWWLELIPNKILVCLCKPLSLLHLQKKWLMCANESWFHFHTSSFPPFSNTSKFKTNFIESNKTMKKPSKSQIHFCLVVRHPPPFNTELPFPKLTVWLEYDTIRLLFEANGPIFRCKMAVSFRKGSFSKVLKNCPTRFHQLPTNCHLPPSRIPPAPVF